MNKIWKYIMKNGFTILMVIFIGAIFVSPYTKSFVLRQLMATGLFNASIDKKSADTSSANHFGFADEKGNVQNTSSLKGKVVFINFWVSWCPPCRAEFPSIERFISRSKITNPDIFFLTINEDSDLATGKAYLEKKIQLQCINPMVMFWQKFTPEHCQQPLCWIKTGNQISSHGICQLRISMQRDWKIAYYLLKDTGLCVF